MSPALANQFQQATPGVLIVLVHFQVFEKLVDAGR